MGHLDLAYGYFRETAVVDLWNLAGNTDTISLSARLDSVLCGTVHRAIVAGPSRLRGSAMTVV